METKDTPVQESAGHPHHGLTLATKVTLVRIMGIPVFIGLLVYYLHALSEGRDERALRWWALVVFALVASTDALDGYLARSRNEITKLGKVLDPIADKGLLLSALVLLTRPSLPQFEPHIPIWFTVLLISRDVLVVIGYFIVHHFAGHVDIHPRWGGKFATAMTMFSICWVLTQFTSPWFFWYMLLTGVLMAFSGFQYLFDGAKQLAKTGRH